MLKKIYSWLWKAIFIQTYLIKIAYSSLYEASINHNYDTNVAIYLPTAEHMNTDEELRKEITAMVRLGEVQKYINSSTLHLPKIY